MSDDPVPKSADEAPAKPEEEPANTESSPVQPSPAVEASQSVDQRRAGEGKHDGEESDDAVPSNADGGEGGTAGGAQATDADQTAGGEQSQDGKQVKDGKQAPDDEQTGDGKRADEGKQAPDEQVTGAREGKGAELPSAIRGLVDKARGKRVEESVGLPSGIRSLVDRARTLTKRAGVYHSDGLKQGTESYKAFMQDLGKTLGKSRPNTRLFSVETYFDPFPYRKSMRLIPESAKPRRKKEWFTYEGLGFNMGAVLSSQLGMYSYRLRLRSRYLATLTIDLDFGEALFLAGEYKGTSLAAGTEHWTEVTLREDLSAGEYFGHILVSADCPYGKEELKLPVYLSVVAAGSASAHPHKIAMPSYGKKPYEKSGKRKKDVNLAFNLPESRSWNM